jgi:hypothetical protein
MSVDEFFRLRDKQGVPHVSRKGEIGDNSRGECADIELLRLGELAVPEGC